MTHHSEVMAAASTKPKTGDSAEKVFAWLSSIMGNSHPIRSKDDLRSGSQARYNPLDIDATLKLSGNFDIFIRGNSIFAAGHKIWVDCNYNVITSRGMTNTEMLENASEMIAELKEWGYDVVHDDEQYHHSNPRRILVKPVSDYLLVSRWMPNIMGGLKSDIQRVDSLGIEGIGTQLYARWTERDRQVPKTQEERQTRILEAVRKSVTDEFGSRGYLPWDFDVQDIDASGNCRLSYSQRRPDLEYVERSVWVSPNPGHDPYSYRVGSNLIEAIESEIRLDQLLEKHGAITMTSLTKKVIENGGMINRNAKGVITAKRRLKINQGIMFDYTIKQKKERIEAEIVIKGQARVFLGTGTFLIENAQLPETVISTMKGESFGRLVEHPVVPDDLIVTSIKNTARGIEGEVRGPTFPWKTSPQRMRKVQNDEKMSMNS